MVRVLRWGTFFVLLLVIVGAAMSYPLLRDRYFAPMLAAPAPTVAILASTATPVTPTATVRTTELATLPAASTTTKPPAVIIHAPSPTVAPPANTDAPTSESTATATPIVIATTSLLSADNAPTITPIVLGPSVAAADGAPNSAQHTQELSARTDDSPATTPVSNVETPTATDAPNVGIGVAIPITAATSTPTEEAAEPPAPGEKGFQPTAVVDTVIAAPPLTTTQGTPMPIVVAALVVTTVEVTSATAATSTAATEVTPIVITTVELTPQPDTPTPQPSGPTTNGASPLFSAPDFNSAIVGQVAVGEQLTIIGLYTEGNWYLLVNGLWIPGAVVDNAPFALPLVFPTMTPVPTMTPTITPTPVPTATPLGSATPTPTATSLDQPVCDCSGDNLDCLGNIFADRTQAQQCFEYCFRQTGRDIHLLDPNLNGMACENLPNALPGTTASIPAVSGTSCDSNYTGTCIPVVNYDLNCSDVSARNFRRVGSDPHGFDRDDDGIACEEGD